MDRLSALTLLCLAGVVAIGGCSVPKEYPAVTRDELAAGPPNAELAGTPDELVAPAKVPGNARSRVSCAGCGVVESLRTIQRREEVIPACAAGDSDELGLPGSLLDIAGRNDTPLYADTIARPISGHRGPGKVRVTTSHQIVVRLRDGSRHVVDEEAPRTLRVGERVQFIEGATASNG